MTSMATAASTWAGLWLDGGLREALELDGDGSPTAAVFSGAQLLHSLQDKQQQQQQSGGFGATVDAHVVLRGTAEAEAVVRQLPAGLHVRGTLVVAEAPGASLAFPAQLTVDASLLVVTRNLQRTDELRSLSFGRGLHVGAELSLGGCQAVQQLPEGLYVGGSLDLQGCEALTCLPDRMRVLGGIDLSRCAALTQLPAGLRVGGDLELRKCASLTRLPEDLELHGSLELRFCRALTALPAGLHVRRLLDVAYCSALDGLPAGLRVDGDLDARYCRALSTLPGDLRVGGTVDLGYCTGLTELPEGLSVGGDLLLRNCSRLAGLPEALTVGADLSLERCAALESLPAAVLAWPAREDTGEPHNVFLGGSGLSQEAFEWLRAAHAPGLRFHVDLLRVRHAALAEQDLERPAFESAGAAAEFWAAQAGVELDLERELGTGWLVAEQEATLVRFLARLRSAKEFGIAETRRALAKRVVAVVELLARDEDVRPELLLRMDDSLDTCGDKPVWALNQMTLTVEIAKARGHADALRDLGRRVMRLMVVHEHAQRKVDSLQWVDDVCVYLRFEIDLREALDLPVDASGMIFPAYIEVTDAELEAAKDDALAITDDQFAAWLAQWPEWQRQQRRETASQLSAWQDLPTLSKRASMRKRLSRRLSQLLSVTGDAVADPVQLNGCIWSLRDLLRHWERTGLDLYNSPVSPDQLRQQLRRCV